VDPELSVSLRWQFSFDGRGGGPGGGFWVEDVEEEVAMFDADHLGLSLLMFLGSLVLRVCVLSFVTVIGREALC
jgi:hypothetical protein